MKRSQHDQAATQLEVRGYPEGSFQKKYATGTFPSQPQQSCSVRYMAQPQAPLISVLPLPLHPEIPELLLPHTGADKGWPGHVSAAAAAVTQTAFLRPCSPGTISAKDIRKLGREKVAPRQKAELGSLGKGTISASQPQHQSISPSCELQGSTRRPGGPMGNQTEGVWPNS